jgi:NAD(P)-dependent dehydrogenase (short-subunit alcohol dehydrogenase family)
MEREWAPDSGSLHRFGDEISAVVTGANRGLGLAFCRQLLRVPRVSRIHAACRNPEAAKDLAALSASELSRLRILPMDVTKEPSIAQMAARVGEEGRPVNLVINVAGLLHRYSADGDGPGPERRLADIDPQWLEESFRVNASGPLLVAKHLQPLLPRRAHAVFASISARVGSIGDNRLGGWYAYRGSKAAQNMFTRSLGIELRRRAAGIVCVGLHPGTTDTGLSRPFQKGVPPGKLFTPDRAAGYLLTVIDGLDSDDNGSFFAWDGAEIPW